MSKTTSPKVAASERKASREAAFNEEYSPTRRRTRPCRTCAGPCQAGLLQDGRVPRPTSTSTPEHGFSGCQDEARDVACGRRPSRGAGAGRMCRPTRRGESVTRMEAFIGKQASIDDSSPLPLPCYAMPCPVPTSAFLHAKKSPAQSVRCGVVGIPSRRNASGRTEQIPQRQCRQVQLGMYGYLTYLPYIRDTGRGVERARSGL